jgi:hypothetical protein
MGFLPTSISRKAGFGRYAIGFSTVSQFEGIALTV